VVGWIRNQKTEWFTAFGGFTGCLGWLILFSYFVVAIPAIGVYPMRKNFKKEDIL
jgi:hypothetical protein